MGIRDALHSLRSGKVEDLEGGTDSSVKSAVPEPDDFKPRQDGTYVGGPDDGSHRYLRFFATGKVYQAGGGATVEQAQPLLGRDNPDPIVGQYTGVGKFTVQQRFERPIIYTVLEVDDSGFLVRLTASGSRHTGEYRYEFVPDHG